MKEEQSSGTCPQILILFKRDPDGGRLTLFLHGSEDLLLLVQAATNAVKKRLDMASRELADFLNVSIFGAAGPGKMYAKILGATGKHAGISLLDGLCGSDYKKAPFPTSDALAAGSPLVKGDYQSKRELHFTIGMLRVFDAQVIFVSASRLSFLLDSELVRFAGEQPNAWYRPMLQLSLNEQKIH
jgi:hypothetical protein